MRYGLLFSGAGLGDFGFEMAGLELAWQVENNEYCRKILDLRWPEVKKYGDIKKVKDLEPVDLIAGGFPCQPFSVAGKQNGANDNRNLWPEMLRVVKEVKPRWVVCENVPGIIPIYLDVVLADLANEGYTCWPFVFSSHSLGAWHRRERLWIICNAQHNGQSPAKKPGSVNQGNDRGEAGKKEAGESSRSGKQHEVVAESELLGCVYGQSQEQSAGGGVDAQRDVESGGENVADTKIAKQERCGDSRAGGARPSDSSKIISDPGLFGSKKRQKQTARVEQCGEVFRKWWEVEPGVGRVADGCSHRVDRLKALGNGQTPCSTYVIGKYIMEFESAINNPA